MLYLTLIMALNFDISLQNRHQDISFFLHQLELETIVIVTEVWINGEKSLNIRFSVSTILCIKLGLIKLEQLRMRVKENGFVQK